MFSFLYYTSGNDIGELHTYIEEYKDEFEKLGEEDEVGKVVFNNVIAKLGDIDTITYEDIIGIIVNNKDYEVYVDEIQVNHQSQPSSQLSSQLKSIRITKAFSSNNLEDLQ